MTLTKFFFVVTLIAILAPPMRAHAQQPQSQRPAAIPNVDLSGRWRFTSFGSTWTVDLKLDPKKTTSDEKVYCGEAARERTTPDTPIIKAPVCAAIDPEDGQLHVDVQAAACRAPWQTGPGTMEGTCSKGSNMPVMRMDDATSMPMGGFTATRISGGPKK